jgi:molecular chaperone GrpE (heat shock protein)
MRPSRPRFPFLITPFPGDSPGSRPVPAAAEPEPVPAGERLNEIVSAVAELRGHMETHSEKMSKVMTKIGLLETVFDEFLESFGKEDDLASFFEKLIPVLDNLVFLKRAVEGSGEEEWQKGMAIFYEKLFKLLRDFGIEPAAQIGMNFDPSRHESVDTAVNPGLPPGSVADVVLEGWTYNGRLLRFAKVIVVKEK